MLELPRGLDDVRTNLAEKFEEARAGNDMEVEKGDCTLYEPAFGLQTMHSAESIGQLMGSVAVTGGGNSRTPPGAQDEPPVERPSDAPALDASLETHKAPQRECLQDNSGIPDVELSRKQQRALRKSKAQPSKAADDGGDLDEEDQPEPAETLRSGRGRGKARGRAGRGRGRGRGRHGRSEAGKAESDGGDSGEAGSQKTAAMPPGKAAPKYTKATPKGKAKATAKRSAKALPKSEAEVASKRKAPSSDLDNAQSKKAHKNLDKETSVERKAMLTFKETGKMEMIKEGARKVVLNRGDDMVATAVPIPKGRPREEFRA